MILMSGTHKNSMKKSTDYFSQVPLKIQQNRNSVSVGEASRITAGRRLDSFHGESSHRRQPPHQWCVILAVTGNWSLEYNRGGSCAVAARASGCCPRVESLTLSQTLCCRALAKVSGGRHFSMQLLHFVCKRIKNLCCLCVITVS